MDIPFPRMGRIRQRILSRPLDDLADSIASQVARLAPDLPVGPGATVAVGCSSRGITGYARVPARGSAMPNWPRGWA